MPLSGLVMQPHEMEIVQAVFNTIVAEPWFDHEPWMEKAFAAFVLRAYRDGIIEPDRLENYCREAASKRYGRQ